MHWIARVSDNTAESFVTPHSHSTYSTKEFLIVFVTQNLSNAAVMCRGGSLSHVMLELLRIFKHTITSTIHTLSPWDNASIKSRQRSEICTDQLLAQETLVKSQSLLLHSSFSLF
mmetsp:Transcript_3752/g.14227  ORF Transcript_3752/g.14227 Transcript_3752/m.14227 type:complete len:115 (-) Transcript_3752:865-1209(-)